HSPQEAQYAATLDFLIVVAASGRTCSYKLIAVRTLGLRLTAPSRSPTAPDTPCISSKAAGQGGCPTILAVSRRCIVDKSIAKRLYCAIIFSMIK
ncbi:MAG: hypothetical protein KJ793_06205, partial [Candidatus Omnitrophica bacterium]|nr:hypothetical protein [Candidatus Omnitrophota bacterium]